MDQSILKEREVRGRNDLWEPGWERGTPQKSEVRSAEGLLPTTLGLDNTAFLNTKNLVNLAPQFNSQFSMLLVGNKS